MKELILPFLPFSAKITAPVAGLSGLLGFTLTELLTNQYVLAAMSGLLASVVGAALVVIPRVMTAKTEARKAEADISSGLWKRAIEFSRDEVLFYQERLAEKDLVTILNTRSKHNLLSEGQRLLFHINLLESMLRAVSVEPPVFNAKTYQELVGEEDKLIQEKAEKRAVQAQRKIPVDA